MVDRDIRSPHFRMAAPDDLSQHEYQTDQHTSHRHYDVEFRLKDNPDDAVSAEPKGDPNDLIQNLTTSGELQSLSHLDDPNDSLYMIFGVLIAMILVGLIIVLLAITINKLRKREESNNNNNNSRRHGNNAVHPQDGVVATTPVLTAKSVDLPVVANGQSHIPAGLTHTAVELTEVDGEVVEMKVANPVTASPAQAPQLQLCIWNLPTTRSAYGTQVSLFSGDQTALVQNNHFQGDLPRECKGFRKNLRGKWKRLVQKKQPNPEMFSIPAELRPQLKQIYVY